MLCASRAVSSDSVQRQSARDLEGKIALIQTEIQNLESARDNARRQASQFRGQHTLSRIRGKIDSYMAEAQGMELQVDAMTQQIAALHLQETNLKNSLRDAQAAVAQ